MIKKLLIASAALTAGLCSGAAGAGSLGFEGIWGLVGTHCATSGDLVPTEITSSEILYYESSCRFSQVEPIGDWGVSWRVEAQCSGEGETWPAIFIIGLHELQPGQMLSMVDLTDGDARLAERCD